jgi:hypothetical protein
MRATIIGALIALSVSGGVAIAADQANSRSRAQSGESNPSGSLSHVLSQSGGVIHPPPSADRNVVPPPNQDSSRTPVIRPPGTPGGNPAVQPK